MGLGLVTRNGAESGEVLRGTSVFNPHDASGHKSKPPRCVMVVDVGSSGYRLYVSTCTRSLAASTREIASSLKPFLVILSGEPLEQGSRQSPGLIRCAVETGSGLSHNWFVAATQMGFSSEQPKAETASSARIAAGLILGLACFAAVLTGGIFVGQTIGEALSTLQTIAPVEVDPLR